jgi:hypothetical protein
MHQIRPENDIPQIHWGHASLGCNGCLQRASHSEEWRAQAAKTSSGEHELPDERTSVTRQ